MQYIQDYDDTSEADTPHSNFEVNFNSGIQITGNEPSENGSATVFFRTKSLLLATFPWFSSLIMVPRKLSQLLEDPTYQHYGIVHQFLNLF